MNLGKKAATFAGSGFLNGVGKTGKEIQLPCMQGFRISAFFNRLRILINRPISLVTGQGANLGFVYSQFNAPPV
jgi:hypothetical protein